MCIGGAWQRSQWSEWSSKSNECCGREPNGVKFSKIKNQTSDN